MPTTKVTIKAEARSRSALAHLLRHLADKLESATSRRQFPKKHRLRLWEAGRMPKLGSVLERPITGCIMDERVDAELLCECARVVKHQITRNIEIEGPLAPDASTDVILTKKEAAQVVIALSTASSDIWQSARVAESNLTGKDPTFPEDAPVMPETPRLIHRQGLDESYRVHARVGAALAMLHKKIQGETKPSAHE